MIKGEKIILTAAIPGAAILWRNDPEVWKWCRQYSVIDGRQQKRWGESISQDPTVKMFGVYAGGRDHDDAIGVCGLTSIDRQNQSAEFSLYIAPMFQKQGYAKDTLRTLLRHGFMDWNLHRIWGEVFDGNPALKMFFELGFEPEGVLKDAYFRSGRFIDAHRIGMLRSDFQIQPGS